MKMKHSTQRRKVKTEGAKAEKKQQRPQRIQLRRIKGWRMPAYTVKVDRTTPWGNPFIVGEHGTQAECVRLFELMCAGYLVISRGPDICDAQKSYLDHAKQHLHDLRGKHLACWCRIGTPCHADVLLKIANDRRA